MITEKYFNIYVQEVTMFIHFHVSIPLGHKCQKISFQKGSEKLHVFD